MTSSTVDFKVKLGSRNERIKVGVPGRFNVYNSMAAITVAKEFGIEADTVREALIDVKVLRKK